MTRVAECAHRVHADGRKAWLGRYPRADVQTETGLGSAFCAELSFPTGTFGTFFQFGTEFPKVPVGPECRNDVVRKACKHTAARS